MMKVFSLGTNRDGSMTQTAGSQDLALATVLNQIEADGFTVVSVMLVAGGESVVPLYRVVARSGAATARSADDNDGGVPHDYPREAMPLG